jgi:excisionase family DNA binding protein
MIRHQSPHDVDKVAERHPPLASLDEVAGYLGKPKQTLRAWRHRGIGPKSFKVGTTVRYRWSDVDAWLELQAEQGNGPTVTAGSAAPQETS